MGNARYAGAVARWERAAKSGKPVTAEKRVQRLGQELRDMVDKEVLEPLADGDAVDVKDFADAVLLFASVLESRAREIVEG